MQLKVNPVVFQNTWADISASITASISTVVTGGTSANEIQRLDFSKKPTSGTFRLTVPTYNVSIDSAITDGIFISTSNHGLAISQPVILSGFTALSGYSNGSQYFVKTIPQSNHFSLTLSPEVAAISGSGLPNGTGFAATILRQTTSVDYNVSTNQLSSILQALDSIGSNNIEVIGASGSYYIFNFVNDKSLTNLPNLIVTNNLFSSPSKAANVDFTSLSLRDLLENNIQATLDLEIELTDANGISTMILTPCIVQEQLIY